MWDSGHPRRLFRTLHPGGDRDSHPYPYKDADIIRDLSPGTRVSVWFDGSGFMKAQFEGIEKNYGIFLIREKVVRIRLDAILAIAIL